MNNVGERLKRLRESKGLSIKQLAEKSGISAVSIGRFERRGLRPALDTSRALADALGVELSEFLGTKPSQRIFKGSK